VSCRPRGTVANGNDRSRIKKKQREPEKLTESRLERREHLVERQTALDWKSSTVAQVIGIETQSLKRWKKRHEQVSAPSKRGRPESIPQAARWKLRECYKAHYCQWGPSVLREWAIREGLGRWNASTIAKVIADLKPEPEKKAKPLRYEIAYPMVMWSEDGTKFKERGKKKELLVLQDECARFKTNWKLADGPANAADVAEYLREAFDKHGAPLVIKHDGGSIFHEQCVQNLFDEYGVVDLTSPPSYPPFNGKKERSMRDIKSYTRALFENRVGGSLEERIAIAMRDLNDERPRPMLNGRTAAEVFQQNQTRLPDRRRFRMEVETRRLKLEAEAGTRTEKSAARRRAVIQVLSGYNLINWRGDVSTYFRNQTGTD
jgi:hypothetical protein